MSEGIPSGRAVHSPFFTLHFPLRHSLLPLFLISFLLLPSPCMADNVREGWLRPYVNGRGLAFDYSSDSIHWTTLGHGRTFVDSDFGTWGAEKKMSDPCLFQDGNGLWTLMWIPNRRYNQYAVCTSPDLVHWKPQDYPVLTPAVERTMQERRSTAIRVPWSLIENLLQRSSYLEARDSRHAESLLQDGERFASLQPFDIRLTFDTNDTKAISDELIGVFFEDISYGADGGLYADLIQNRDFEYTPGENRNDRNWGPLTAWEIKPSDGKADDMEALAIATADPIHPNNPHYAVLTRRGSEPVRLVNKGFDGISIREGETYDLSLFTRKAPGQKSAVRLKVSLQDSAGKTFATTTVKVGHTAWKRQTAAIRPTSLGKTQEDAVLVIEPLDAGTLHLDMVSLFPRHTFKNRPNGLRADLAQAIADIRPKFVRFPGGCVAHGDGLHNMYLWKNTIGPLEARKPMRNIWNYHQTLGLGYYEYFQFCEDIGAEPLPVIPAGVPCQNSSDGGPGQQGGVPWDEMEAFTQDILDLIEWANGDARTTRWGKVRAESGHPRPFNLKHIGIGNEDLISDVFAERFTYIYNKVHERYPDIEVCGTVGPFYEGSDYEWGWRLARELNLPMVDEHYYVSPGWMLHNQDYYDHYDRSAPHVYLGEYAAHARGRRNCMESALCEALYLTNVERNADVVRMTSYAPLLCRDGHSNWNPDMIYFNGSNVRLTPGYYVQQLFGQHSGDRYVSGTISPEENVSRSPLTNESVRRRISCSCVTDSQSGAVIVKICNLLPVEVSTGIDLTPFVGEGGENASAVITTLSGSPADTDAVPTTRTAPAADATLPLTLPAYSFTVVRIDRPEDVLVKR